MGEAKESREKKEEQKADQRQGENIVGYGGWYNCLLDGLISYRVTPRRIFGGGGARKLPAMPFADLADNAVERLWRAFCGEPYRKFYATNG
jgi:hypothetical protein